MGFGRCRMAVLADASGDSLRAFLVDNVEPGARVITDGWPPYRPASKGLYAHQPIPGASPDEALNGVHTVSSLAKRWLRYRRELARPLGAHHAVPRATRRPQEGGLHDGRMKNSRGLGDRHRLGVALACGVGVVDPGAKRRIWGLFLPRSCCPVCGP